MDKEKRTKRYMLALPEDIFEWVQGHGGSGVPVATTVLFLLNQLKRHEERIYTELKEQKALLKEQKTLLTEIKEALNERT